MTYEKPRITLTCEATRVIQSQIKNFVNTADHGSAGGGLGPYSTPMAYEADE
jgi:hypothetical protein